MAALTAENTTRLFYVEIAIDVHQTLPGTMSTSYAYLFVETASLNSLKNATTGTPKEGMVANTA